MSARDLIINSLMKPIETQVDYSQGYDVGLTAQANRITPEQVRQRALADAIQRNQQRIQTQITGQDNTLDSASKLLGYDLREQSSANLRGMTSEQRLQSYITGSNHDPELAYDMQNMNDGYLRGKYGDTVADYAYNQRKTAMQDFQRASSYVPEQEQNGNLATGLAGGLTRGVRQIGGIAEQLGIMAFNDGEEQANKLRQAQKDMAEDISAIAAWQGSQYQHQEEKSKIYTQLADNLRQQKFQQIAAQTGNSELAKTESDKLAEEYHAGLNVITNELMVNGLGEQAPQILLAVLSGGAGAAIAEASAMGISRVVATKAIQTAMPKIIQLGAMTGVGIEAGLQDGTSAAADAHTGVYDYYNQALKESNQGDNTKWNELFGSKEMQALAQQYPEASPDELISLAANNASVSAGLESGLYTGVSAGLAAPTLSGFSSKLGAGLKPSTRWALTSTAPIIEGATEFGEEYVNIVSPRESINKALGVNVHENPSLYATDQALQAGAIGALAGSASTVAGAGSAIGSVGKAVLNKSAKALNNTVKGKVDKIKEEQAQETRNNLNEELKEFIPEVNGEDINSVNVMGTSETTNPDGTTVPAIDGVLPNKNMSNSYFGNALREAVQTKADIESEGKVNGATDYADFISKLHESSVETKLRLDEATKVDNQEEVNSLQQQLDSLNNVRSTLLEAIRQDVNEAAPAYLNTLDEVNKLNQEYMNTSDEAKQDELQTIMESLIVKLASEEKNFEAVNRLFDSKLYQMLSDESYSTELKERSDDKISLEQYIGKKPSTLASVLYATDNVTDIIKETDTVNEANHIVKSWVNDLIKHSKSISKDNASNALSSIKASFNKIKSSLDNKGFQVDYLNKVSDVLGSVDTDKLTGDRAKSLLNKFFIRDSVTDLPSLMDLLILSNSPETRDKALAQLTYFQASQKAKLAGLLNARRTNLPIKGTKTYKTPITNIPTIGSKILKQQNGTPVSFDNENSLNKYIASVEEESVIFDNLVNDILNNTTSIKPANKTTPVNKQDKVNTQTQPKETKPQSTSSLGSEEENTIPVPKKTKSKKDELPPPPPELTEEEIRAVQESVNRSRKTRESIQEESDTNTQSKQENQSESNTAQSKAIPENNPEPMKEEDSGFISQYEYAYEGKPINVWAGSRENVVLSNLAPFEFDYMNFTFESVEHAYQTLKDGKGLTQENRDWAEEHRDTFSTGKTVKRKVKVDTNKNLNLMFDLLRIRAKDDIDFIDKLSSTELREITHKNTKSSHEDIWTKVFPEMLMRLRDEIHSMNDERTREDIITEKVPNTEPVQEQEEVQEQTTNSSEPVQEEDIVTSKETGNTNKQSKEKSLVEPIVDDTGSTVGYSNTNSGNTYLTYEEALNDKEEVRNEFKYISSVIGRKNRAKDVFKENVIKAFNSEKEQNKNERTRNIYGLDEDITLSGISQQTVDTIYSFGFSLDENLLDVHTEVKDENYSSEEVILALNAYTANKDETTAKELVRQLNPEMSEDKLTELVNEDNLEDTKIFLNNFISTFKEVSSYFNLGKYQSVTLNEEIGVMSKLDTFNGFTNLIELNQDNKEVIPTNVLIGITLSTMEQVLDFAVNGNANNKVLKERFERISENGFNVYNNSLSNVSFTLNRQSGADKINDAHSNLIVTKDKKTGKETKIYRDKLPLDTEDISFIGSRRELLAQRMGNSLVSNLNLKFKKNTPSNVEQAITQSLGNELLNMMLSKHLIDNYRVEINTDTVNEETGSVETIKMFYVNGSFNYEREGHFPTNTAKAYNLLMKYFKGALSDKQNNPTTINNATKVVYQADQNNNSWLLLSLDLVANKETALAKEMFKDSFERKGYEISLDGKPIDKFSPKHISDKILDNAPTEMEMAVRGHNAVGYKLDTDMVAMFKTQPEIFKIVSGFHSAKSMEHDLELTKESKKSKNSMVERTMTAIQQILNEVNNVSNEQDAVIHIKHETTETQRVQQAMVNSPQANKIMREVLRVHNGSFDEVEKAYAKKGKMFEYDLNEAQSLLRPVQVAFTLPKADENGVRDVKFLVKQVRKIKDKIIKKKGTEAQQEKYQTDYQNQVGLLLALAQALGVKIEKRNSENILKDVEKKFEQQWLNDLVEDIWNWQQDNSIELKPDNFQKLVDEYDSGAMRAFSVLQAFARYKYSPNKTGSKPTEFSFNVYLEADGIGNGMSNLVRQFTVGFTSTYFQTLKRVGITTLDLIVKVAKEKGLDLTNLSDEAKETLSNNLEGSAAQFDPKGDTKVLDVYEVVSDRITKDLQESLSVLAHPTFKLRMGNLLEKPLKDLVFETKKWQEALERNPHDLFAKKMLSLNNTIKVLNQINVLGHLTGKFYKEGNEYDVNASGFVALMNRYVGGLVDNGVNSKTLTLSINRALAKLGVTPAMYGGGLNGISNQVEKDIIKAAQDKLNSLANQLAKNEPLSQADIAILNNWFGSVGLYESSTGIKWTIRDNINRTTLQFLSNNLPKFKHIISRNLKYGISKKLHEAVNRIYGETLRNANSLIATDTASTNAFALELHTRYTEAQRRRNEEKDYTDTDPRRNDALTNTELKVIIKELETLPIVATAFSGNTVLFQQLLIEGHTIAKDRLIENVNPAYTSANVVNTTGINTALSIASIYSLNMIQKIKSYSAGGATNFTNTVVSTESMVQTVVNFVLGKLGMALLNVYDGLDADSRLARLVGVIANKAYDDVHKNTNLQENLFHRTNKANLGQFITKDKLTPLLKEVLFELVPNGNNILPTDIDISNKEFTREEIQYLDVYFGVMASRHTKVKFLPSAQLAQTFRTATDKATTALLSGAEKVKLDISRNDWFTFQGYINTEFQTHGMFESENITDIPIEAYNSMLDTMAKQAATAAAVKAVESKYLAYNVNQYAGANRGVIINPEQLFKQKGTAQRFAEFIKDKDTNFRQTSDLLAEFVAQDKLIQETYEKAFKDKYNSLSLNFVETGSYKIYQQQRTTTLDKILSDKLKVKKDDNTLIGRTRRVILSLAKDVLPADMKVFFNTNEFLDAVKAQGLNTTNLIKENTSGIFIPNVGIYVNPTREDQSKILTHEIIHAILGQSLHLYYTNRNEWNNLAKGNSKFKELETVIKKLEHNALAFSNLYNSDPNVQKILDIDNLFISNNFNTPNKGAAIIASIRQAFREGDILDTDKYIAMQEFLAYALTEEKLLTQMYYNQKAKDIPNSLLKEPEKNKGLIESIKKLLNLLKEVKLNIARIFFGSKFEEKDLTKDNNFLNESMLFDVLAQMKTLAEMNNNLPNQESTTTLYSTDSSTVIDAHDLFLNELHTLSKTLNFTSRVKESSTATTLLAQNRINQLSSNYIQDIRNTGINISMKEHTAFMLMSGVFEITFSGSNSSLRTEAEKWLNQVFNTLRTNNVFTNEQFKAIFGNRSTFRLTDVMALAVTSKEVKNLLENLPKSEKKRLDGLVDKLTNMTVFLQANRDIIDFKDDTTLEKIALASVHADLNQSMKDSWRETVRQVEKERYLGRQDFYNKVDNLTEPFPKVFSELVTTVVYDWAKASNMDGTGKDTDSIIGTALQNLADYTALSKGRTTFLSQALRWILQAREKTQYIYDKRARLAANMETIRESARSTLPTVIRRAFNSEYSEEMDKYISKAVIPTELSRIYTGSNIEEVAEILQSKTKREDMISSLENDLEVLIRDEFGSATNEVMNWIRWQVKGLASMMINRTAKSNGKGKSHHILGNSRTIASLRNLPIKKDTSIEAETLRIAAFEPYIGKLATLHSLNHVNEIDLTQTVKLINQEKKGMEELLNGQSVTKELYSRSHKFNHLGADGYVHSKSDPHEDMRLVYTGSEEQKQLERLGYYVVQELPNTGMTVMFTNVNPIKRYQTGMFGLAEQSVFGVSVRTKEPLGAITKEYTLRNEEKEAYRQEFTKVSKLAMKNSNYYESLTEDSVLKPVVGHTGFINTYSVELPNSIKNSFIEEVETGIESIGNMQGRILEEGLTAKVNRENIDLLNQKYKESKDKQYFIKIDGKFKAKGSTNADKYFTDRVNEFYTNLPIDTKDYISEVGGLYVYRTEADNILGYHHADLTDIYTGSTPLPTVIQDVTKGLFSVFDMFGVNPVRALRVLQGINAEVVSYGKDVVLNKSVVVGAGNILSNAVHLVNLGINPKKIVPDAREGLINAQNYVRNFARSLELKYRLANSKLTAEERMLLEPELRFLLESLNKNPVAPLVKAGIMSSISGAAGYEKTFDTSEHFTYLHKAKDKLGLNKVQNKFDNSSVGKVVNNILISRDSAAHEFMNKALDYGDFVAKYVLFKHLTQEKGFSEERAMNVIREEFINYTMNKGALFDYANAMGLTWFASYALGIQKVIYRALRRNTLSTLAIYSTGSVINDYDRLGLLGNVPNQNLFDRNWSYTADTSNILDSFEAHYLARLLAWLF